MIILEGFSHDERLEISDESWILTDVDLLRLVQLLLPAAAPLTRRNSVAYVTIVYSPLTDESRMLESQVPGDASNAQRYRDYAGNSQESLFPDQE